MLHATECAKCIGSKKNQRLIFWSLIFTFLEIKELKPESAV